MQSIPREQHEAAAALGFGWVGRHAFVILPQALRRLLPPLVSLLVNIIQNTTIAQVIGAAELLEAGERPVERLAAPPPIGLGEIHAFEIYAAVMVDLLPDLVPAHAAGRVPRAAARLRSSLATPSAPVAPRRPRLARRPRPPPPLLLAAKLELERISMERSSRSSLR